MYRNGQGTRIDHQKCRSLLHTAAARGHIFAKRKLMIMYFSGAFGLKNVWRGSVTAMPEEEAA
jgi:TPR repeat protein